MNRLLTRFHRELRESQEAFVERFERCLFRIEHTLLFAEYMPALLFGAHLTGVVFLAYAAAILIGVFIILWLIAHFI